MSSIPLVWDLPQVSAAVREWLRLRAVILATPELADQMRALEALDQVEHAMSPADRETARDLFWQHEHADAPDAVRRLAWRRCFCFACRDERGAFCN